MHVESDSYEPNPTDPYFLSLIHIYLEFYTCFSMYTICSLARFSDEYRPEGVIRLCFSGRPQRELPP
jgi:hypothetical protein